MTEPTSNSSSSRLHGLRLRPNLLCTNCFCCLFSLIFEQPFATMVRPMLSDHCLSVCLSCPVCNVCVLLPNGWMDQDETWHGGRPRSWPHCYMGTQLPLPQRSTAPNFRLIAVVAKWLDQLRFHLVRTLC